MRIQLFFNTNITLVNVQLIYKFFDACKVEKMWLAVTYLRSSFVEDEIFL